MLNFIIFITIIYMILRINLSRETCKVLEQSLNNLKNYESKSIPITISYDVLTERGYREEIKSFKDYSTFIEFLNAQKGEFNYSYID